jgi:hypothetical protein
MIEDEETKVSISPGMAHPLVIFEQIFNDANGNNYLVWDRTERKLRLSNDVWSFFVLDWVKYIPLEHTPWPVASCCERYGTEIELYYEIRSFLVEHLDVANELFYDVYTCFVLASWRLEDFKVVPYLFFRGPLSSGKTRALECLQHLCYRAILAASMSPAALFRVLQAWHPTLLLDESEIYNKENMIEALAILNSGYRKGQMAIRIIEAKKGNLQIGQFDTFGLKAVAGTEELAATLQSRCIITPMSRAVRQVRLFINEEKAQSIINKLLQYRFNNLGSKAAFPAEEFSKNTGISNGRVIELFISLFQVAPSEEIRKGLLECMKQITQSRLDEEQASIEARIFESILKCRSQVKNSKLSTQIVTENFNDGLGEKDQVTSRLVGRRISGLGFEKCRVGDKGQAGFFWDDKLINRLEARYSSFVNKTTSETPETSETPVQSKGQIQTRNSTEDSEVTEETEVKSENSITIREIIDHAKSQLPSVFSEDKLIAKIVELKVSVDDALKYVQHFKEKCFISQDDIGGWYWVRVS